MRSVKEKLLENDFGAYLYDIRCKKEYTIEEVVQKINMPLVTTKTVRKWEHDMQFPDLDQMYKISEIYEIPVEELMQIRTQTLEEGLKGVHKTLIRFIGYILGFSIYGIYIMSYVVMFAGGIWAMLIWAEVPKAILQMVAGS